MSNQRVLDRMAEAQLDVLLLGREGNAQYASGARRLFLASGRAFAPGCVVVHETATAHVLGVGDAGVPAEHMFPMSWNPATLMQRICALPGVAGANRIGVDAMTPLFGELLAAFLPGAEFVDAEPLMRAVRQVKTAAEIDAIRAAIAVADQSMAAARTAVQAGAHDREVSAAAMAAMAAAGVTTAAFEPVIARMGAIVAVDVGVLRDGWEGGMARTVPGAGVPAAHAAVLADCRAGAVAPAGAYGVGLGYEVLASGTALRSGMVISVATAGVRDVVLVTDAEPDVLTGDTTYD